MGCGEHVPVADECSSTEPLHLALVVSMSQARGMGELPGQGGFSADYVGRVAQASVQGMVDRTSLDREAKPRYILPDAILIHQTGCGVL